MITYEEMRRIQDAAERFKEESVNHAVAVVIYGPDSAEAESIDTARVYRELRDALEDVLDLSTVPAPVGKDA